MGQVLPLVIPSEYELANEIPISQVVYWNKIGSFYPVTPSK